jgi:hypothetical protein
VDLQPELAPAAPDNGTVRAGTTKPETLSVLTRLGPIHKYGRGNRSLHHLNYKRSRRSLSAFRLVRACVEPSAGIGAEPGLVSARVLWFVDPGVDAATHVLNEGPVEPRVHVGHPEGRIDGERSLVQTKSLLEAIADHDDPLLNWELNVDRGWGREHPILADNGDRR